MLLAKAVDYLSRSLGVGLHIPLREASPYDRSKPGIPDTEVFREATPHFRGPLGKLGLKHEPAGKIRVFAMVDCWTQ